MLLEKEKRQLERIRCEDHSLNVEFLLPIIDRQQAEIERLKRMTSPVRLFEAIKHGNSEHQAWLKEALCCWFNDEPIPPAKGLNDKDTLLSQAEAALESIAKHSYGYQSLIENGADDEQIADYFAKDCDRRKSIARQALAAIAASRKAGG